MPNRPEEHGEALARQLQQAIEQIQGVLAARVIVDPNDEVLEVHLVGSSSRRAKHIVRDTESLLCARYGIRVDYRRIGVVQIEPAGGRDLSKRLRFVSANPHPRDANRIQVVLRGDTDRYEGTALVSSGAGEEPSASAAAEATLSALRRAIGVAVPLAVEGTQITSANDDQVCLAFISASTPTGQERLMGTCVIADNLFEAASKATLDAINRRLPTWIITDDVGETKDSLLTLARV